MLLPLCTVPPNLNFGEIADLTEVSLGLCGWSFLLSELTHLRCDWYSVILVEHTDSKNSISLAPGLYLLQSRGEGTSVPGQGIMKRQWGAMLGLLWVQICCESGVIPERGLGSVRSCQWAGGGRADLGLLDGPSSSGAPERVSWSGNPIHDPSVTSYVFVFLFPSRGERSEGGAESCSLEAPGRSRLYSEVQFF